MITTVFGRSGTVWTEKDQLPDTAFDPDSKFGHSVALISGTALVGAPGDDQGVSNKGAVFVFIRTGPVWVQQAKLLASDAAAGDNFGAGVSLQGSIAAAGAGGVDPQGLNNSGAAYLFERVGTTWTQKAKVTADVPTPGDLLGSSVALSGDRFLAGAPSQTGGKAHVFRFVPNGTPTLFHVSPSEVLFHSPTFIELTTHGFSQFANTTVLFGRKAATNVVWTSPETLVALAPTSTQGDVVDVTVEQAVVTATEAGAFSYVGTSVTGVSPDIGPAGGNTLVTVEGELFVDSPETSVLFGSTSATVVSIDTPKTLVVKSPSGIGGSTVDVTVSGPNGIGVLADAFTYEALTLHSVTPALGNINGGTLVTLAVDLPTSVPDTTVSIGGKPAQVVSVTGGAVKALVPSVTEVPSAPVDVSTTNSNGTAYLASAFTYTPVQQSTITGNIQAGSLNVDWITDPAAGSSQQAWFWLGDAAFPVPPTGLSFQGYAGKLHQVPLVFVLTGFPVQFAPLALGFGPLPAAVIGVPLPFQSLVSGEGGTKGTFTNVVSVTIQG